MNTNKMETSFAVVGCGRLGISLAVFLSRRGYVPAAFCSKTRASAEAAAAHAGSGSVHDDPAEAARAARLVFIATPDTQIEPVCRTMAEQGGFHAGHTVFHLSGALSSTVLSAAKKAGADKGSLHPLQAFAPYQADMVSPFEGINMSVEGDPDAVAAGRDIVAALGARAFVIPTDAKVLYHASAVAASNYLVTLEHFALSLLMQTGLDEQRAYEILEPLIHGTLANLKARGSVDALTGPVARGDHVIISRHLADIDEKMPRFSELYRILGRHTLDIARQQKGFPNETGPKLSGLFE